MGLAERLRACRKMVSDLSARELGLLSDVPGQTVRKLESPDEVRKGERVAAKTVIALARVLGTSAEWLMDGDGNAPDAFDVQAAIARARANKNPSAA